MSALALSLMFSSVIWGLLGTWAACARVAPAFSRSSLVTRVHVVVGIERWTLRRCARDRAIDRAGWPVPGDARLRAGLLVEHRSRHRVAVWRLRPARGGWRSAALESAR